MSNAPPFSQQVTFINCSDLEAATAFYGGVCDLPLVYSAPGFVHFFQTSPGAFVACCLRSERMPGDVGGAIPGFIVSSESEVDAWQAKLIAAGVEITKAAGPGRSSDGKDIPSIYNVMARDPSGYIVEFQMFRDPSWPSLPVPLSVETKNKADQSSREEWCVLLVDLQQDFYTAPVQEAFPDLPARVSALTSAARANGVEVVHLREGSNPTQSPWYRFWQRMNPGKSSAADPLAPLEPCAVEQQGEQVCIKYGYDGTGDHSGLTAYLLRRNKSKVILCGLVTSCCVHLNASGLFLRGFETYVVEDCCGDRTKEMHSSTLQRENRRSYCVVTQADVEKALNEMADGRFLDLVECASSNTTQFEK